MSLSETQLDQLIAERSADYGEPIISFTNLGMAWTALLQCHFQCALPGVIPAHVAAQMMAILKLFRASRAYKLDNYHDLAAFAKFAQQFHATLTSGRPATIVAGGLDGEYAKQVNCKT